MDLLEKRGSHVSVCTNLAADHGSERVPLGFRHERLDHVAKVRRRIYSLSAALESLSPSPPSSSGSAEKPAATTTAPDGKARATSHRRTRNPSAGSREYRPGPASAIAVAIAPFVTGNSPPPS